MIQIVLMAIIDSNDISIHKLLKIRDMVTKLMETKILLVLAVISPE